jgi:general secretion pathway protein I
MRNKIHDLETKVIVLSSQTGFTLLEILCAFLIFGITITVIMQQFSAGLRIGRLSHTYTTATIYATQKLEELQVEEEIEEKEDSGSFEDGYSWRVRIEPYEDYLEEEDEGLFEHLPLEMYRLESVVWWDEGKKEKSITLTTLKTVKKKQGL